MTAPRRWEDLDLRVRGLLLRTVASERPKLWAYFAPEHETLDADVELTARDVALILGSERLRDAVDQAEHLLLDALRAEAVPYELEGPAGRIAREAEGRERQERVAALRAFGRALGSLSWLRCEACHARVRDHDAATCPSRRVSDDPNWPPPRVDVVFRVEPRPFRMPDVRLPDLPALVPPIRLPDIADDSGYRRPADFVSAMREHVKSYAERGWIDPGAARAFFDGAQTSAAAPQLAPKLDLDGPSAEIHEDPFAAIERSMKAAANGPDSIGVKSPTELEFARYAERRVVMLRGAHRSTTVPHCGAFAVEFYWTADEGTSNAHVEFGRLDGFATLHEALEFSQTLTSQEPARRAWLERESRGYDPRAARMNVAGGEPANSCALAAGTPGESDKPQRPEPRMTLTERYERAFGAIPRKAAAHSEAFVRLAPDVERVAAGTMLAVCRDGYARPAKAGDVVVVTTKAPARAGDEIPIPITYDRPQYAKMPRTAPFDPSPSPEVRDAILRCAAPLGRTYAEFVDSMRAHYGLGPRDVTSAMVESFARDLRVADTVGATLAREQANTARLRAEMDRPTAPKIELRYDPAVHGRCQAVIGVPEKKS